LALTIVQAHRGDPEGEKARRFMVDLFRLLPEDSELVSTFRRRLSTALY
jgi:thioredoxin-like negative regulator of GroEL